VDRLSKTRERVEKLAALLDSAILAGHAGGHERIGILYEVFHQEREYLNVELDTDPEETD
jgi:hypothetical protein